MDNFNIIMKQIIKKSLFTNRQIEIITGIRDDFTPISRGAYYRQRAQAAQKAEAVLYSMVLLYGLGVIPRESVGAAAQIGDQLSVIFDSDVDEQAAAQVLAVIEEAINRVLGK